MIDGDLRKLSKNELISLLIERDRQADALALRAEELTREVANRQLATKNIGSIAEAALAVNGVFQSAQRAADQYLATVYEMKTGAKQQCDAMLAESERYCETLRRSTEEKCRAMEKETKDRCDQVLYDAAEQAKIKMASLVYALRDFYLANEDLLAALPQDLQYLIRNP